MSPVLAVVISIVVLIVGIAIGYVLRKNVGEKSIGSAEQQAQNMILDAQNTVENLKKVLDGNKPVFGLGLGYHLIAKAAGCEMQKLQHPHRGANQPIRREGSNRTYISAQNVCRTVKPSSIPSAWEVYFTNLNDGAVDGIRHTSKPFIGLNFHPEVCVGLTENVTPLDEFISKL